MNTTEKNKLIAEFLQVDKNENGTFELPQYGTIRLNGDFKTEFTAENLQYHKDWNWLMEVVEKIENLKFYPKNSTCIGFDSFGIEINKNRCDITRYGDFTHLLLQGQGKKRIESVYNACVDFIKWYNQQN